LFQIAYRKIICLLRGLHTQTGISSCPYDYKQTPGKRGGGDKKKEQLEEEKGAFITYEENGR
jgi:hypothetical protein